jgi:hypothetical protein
MKRKAVVVSLVAALGLLMFAVSPVYAAAPFLTSISPTSGPPDCSVTLTGGNFGYESDCSICVTFTSTDGKQYDRWYLQSWYIMTATTLKFLMPPDAKPGTIATTSVQVWGGGISNKLSFSFTSGPPPKPVITNVSPNPFSSRGIVTINGSNFPDVRSLDDRVIIRDKKTGTEYQPESYPVWSIGQIKIRVPQLVADIYDFIVSIKEENERTDTAITGSASASEDPAPPGDVVQATSRTWATDSIGTAAPAKNWYLPEGSTANGEETYILVQNPGAGAASVKITYVTSSGTKTVNDTVPANSRKTHQASEAFPNNGGVSAKVESNVPVVAEKAVYGNHRAWAHESIGISAPATNWYLAEGCTAPGYATRVSVMNPNATPAKIALTYMTTSGPKAGPSETLAANMRKSYDVGKTVSSAWSVSTQVTSDVPVAAERAMFGTGGNWSHDSVGVSALAKAWYLAEGSTGPGFETWVLVQNPNTTPAKVSLTYMTPGGAVPGPGKTLSPKSRETFEVAKTVPGAWEVSTKVTSDQPVVAERAMYLSNRQKDATDSVGVSALSKAWYLAEGCPLRGFESWVLVQNPNGSPARVTFTYMTSNGAVRGPSETLPANSRKTYNIADTVNLSTEVSTQVTSDSNIAVERSMYGDPK